MHSKYAPLWRCFNNALIAHQLDSDIEAVAKTNIPIQVLLADKDEMAPFKKATKLVNMMRKIRGKTGHSTVKLHVYKDAFHSFVLHHSEHVAAKIAEPMISMQ